MATVTSATPDDELKTLYMDNCSWFEVQDPAMAARFVSVCEAILFRGVMSVDVNGAQVMLRPEVVERQMKAAKSFAAAGRGTNVRFANLEGFRR